MAWNGSNTKQSASAPVVEKHEPPKVSRGLLAGVIIVLGALAAAYFLLWSGDAPAPAKPTPARTVSKDATPVAPAKPKLSKPAPVSSPKSAGVASRPAADRKAASDAAKPVAPVDAKPKKKTNAVFKTATDQLIYLAVFASKGAPIPPLPQLSPADTDQFLDSLREDIEIDPDDPPHVQKMKRDVERVRQEIAGMIAQNPDQQLSEILNSHRDQFNHGIDLRTEAQQCYDKLREEGDDESAAIYLKKANELLESYGAEPIGSGEEEETAEEPENLEQKGEQP